MRLLLGLLMCCPLLARAQNEDGDEASPMLVSPGSINLYYDSQGPMSFVAATPRDLPRQRVEAGEVTGRTCQYGFSIPIQLALRPQTISAAAGDGGYVRTLKMIHEEHPTVAGLYDVRVDIQTMSVLGFFLKSCTIVVARAYL